MSQTEKSAYFKALKAAGVTFEKHYREYNTEELKAAYHRLNGEEAPMPEMPTIETDAVAESFFGFGGEVLHEEPLVAPVAPKNPDERAGERLNAKDVDEPIRTDPETGRVWYQEEVRKPAYPAPRARRVLRYKDPGVVEQTVKAGDYTETFEISGDMSQAREAEVKITLPSFQVGVYSDPRYPFKVICYNENEGFDLEDIRNYWGGSELVPGEVKLKYVENILCYDMRSVIRQIEGEYRALTLRQQAMQ